MNRFESSEQRLSKRACVLLAIAAAAIGATSAAVTADFFVLCMQRLEADQGLRASASAAGVTMIVAELLVFSVAGMLPRVGMRGLRRRLVGLGCVLLAFEVTTMSAAQIAMNEVASARADAATTHVNALRSSIAAQSETLRALRANAEQQSESRHSWERVGGANSLKDALQAQIRLDAQTRELADAESAATPTSSDVLGKNGMIAFSIARAMLLACIGAVMFGAAGALMRTSREDAPASNASRASASPDAQRLPPLRNTGGQFALAVSVPAAFAAPAPAISMHLPTAPVAVDAVRPASMHSASEAVSHNDAPNDASAYDDERFAVAREAVLTGRVKPSLRALYRHCGASQGVASRYLARLERAGEIRKAGRGYVVAT